VYLSPSFERLLRAGPLQCILLMEQGDLVVSVDELEVFCPLCLADLGKHDGLYRKVCGTSVTDGL